jgi:hypothetical protein
MIVRIDSLERGQRKTKKGFDQVGIQVDGVRFKEGQEEGPWSRFFTDQFDSDIVAALEKIGVGNMADIKMEKNGQYWNPVSAKAAGKQSDGGSQGNAPAPKKEEKKSSVSRAELEAMDKLYTRQEALERAVQLVNAAVQLNATSSIFPKTKMTLDLLAQETLSVAEMFENYLMSKAEGTPKADTTAVTEGKKEEAGPIPDEDVPF